MDSALYFFGTLFCICEQQSDGFFSSSCGLRQGNLLPPLLFLIVMKALSIMIYAIANEGLLSSFLVGSRNYGPFNSSHLLFSDDTLFFAVQIHILFITFVACSYALKRFQV